LGIGVTRNVTLRSREEHMAVMNDRNTRGWVVDAQGLNTASWGLFLTPLEMATIGRLYLQGGLWEGQRIVPSGWIADSTREHSRCAQWGNLAYGYLWWIIDDDSYAAIGDGGNVIYINTRHGLVVSVASLLAPDSKDVLELIKTRIEPALGLPS
jgi:CubicO group peptidase (beta-lactamase class C family)